MWTDRLIVTKNSINNLWAQRKISGPNDRLDKVLYEKIKLPKSPSGLKSTTSESQATEKTFFKSTLDKSKQFFKISSQKKLRTLLEKQQKTQYSPEHSPLLEQNSNLISRIRSETTADMPTKNLLEIQSKTLKNRLQTAQNRNEEYFSHLQGDCKCGTCTCLRCKCKIRDFQPEYSRNIKTIYQDELNRENKQNIPLDKPFLLDKEDYISPNKMELQSICQKDYNHKQAQHPYKEVINVSRDTLNCGYINLDYNTTYSKNFSNKIIPQAIRYAPLTNQVVPYALPFSRSSSETKTQFKGTPENKNLKAINFAQERDRKLRPPIDVPIDLYTQTTYDTTHQNWFTQNRAGQGQGYTQHSYRIKNQHILDKKTSLETQFLSDQKREFVEKKIAPCPAQQLQQLEDQNQLSRTAYMYRLYNETKGKYN